MISATCFVKNEETNIAKWLYMLVPFFEEVVVVDTGSTDDTIPIIKGFQKWNNKIKLYNYEWNDNFSMARNFCYDQCKEPWILVVSPNSFYYPGEFLRIREHVKNSPESIYGFEIELKQFYDAPGVNKRGGYHLRLIRNDPRLRHNIERPVHESLYEVFDLYHLKYGRIGDVLLKHVNDEGFSRNWVRKHNLYTRLLHDAGHKDLDGNVVKTSNLVYGSVGWFAMLWDFLNPPTETQ